LAITVTILAANFIGDSLMTALDPRGESLGSGR
jgi:ABC-type dipeptide/oligopeptide/nickel transport system permease subunit